MSQFQQPGISNPEDKFVPAENNGALLLFFPTQLQTQVKTAHGEADAVAARIVRLNDGRVYDNALIFPTGLVTQLKGAVPDGMVLGTLYQGENTKGNPPWLLRPHNEQEVQQAEAWLAANPRNQFQSAPAPAPAAPAWGQQAPAAPAAGGWGSPPPAAPAGNGWGAPAAPAPATSGGASWGAQAPATAPAAAPAPAQAATGSWGAQAPSGVDPGLVEALRKKGVNLPPNSTQESAESIWAIVGGNPDVA